MNWQQLLDFVTCPELFGTLKSPLNFYFYFYLKGGTLLVVTISEEKKKKKVEKMNQFWHKKANKNETQLKINPSDSK